MGGGWTLLTTRRALALPARERETVPALADLAGHLLERLERS